LVKHVDAVELRIAIAVVLATAADAVLVAHHLPNFVPFWLPHWLACMCKISRGEAAWRQRARGEKRAGAEKRKENRVKFSHGKQEMHWSTCEYSERENQVILPLKRLVLWAPCKTRWVWAGAVAN
jgi:hypothetical protein